MPIELLPRHVHPNARGCNGKGFITDGEENLQQAFEDELKNTRGLRCFKLFENNCKEKLREIAVRHEKEQRFFLHQVFGIPGKQQGILDTVY